MAVINAREFFKATRITPCFTFFVLPQCFGHFSGGFCKRFIERPETGELLAQNRHICGKGCGWNTK